MPHFSLRETTGAQVCHNLEKDIVVIGRAPSCDLIVADETISRRHAEIRRGEDSWSLSDLGSRHGTQLNGIPVRNAARLERGDEITIGSVKLVFDTFAPSASELPRTRSRVERAVAPAEPRLLGGSPSIRAVLARIDRVAASTASVLLTGESGTGKEVVARLIHQRSSRASGPFEVVNCPALPPGLAESELFGVERRVATEVDARAGRLERAHGGTLFLDEIGDLEAAVQAKLLRFLQDRTIERIGGRRSIPLDLRVISATNHDLDERVASGSFRLDLLHRLNTVRIVMPPLRERREDIPALVEHFLARFSRPPKTLSATALAALEKHDFPGNVRELQQILEGATLLATDAVIAPEDLGLPETQASAGADDAVGLETAVDGLYRRIVAGGESFWDVVQKPFLRRTLPHAVARALAERAFAEGGGSKRRAARLFRVVDFKEYRKFSDFVRNHGLLGEHGEGDDVDGRRR